MVHIRFQNPHLKRTQNVSKQQERNRKIILEIVIDARTKCLRQSVSRVDKKKLELISPLFPSIFSIKTGKI